MSLAGNNNSQAMSDLQEIVKVRPNIAFVRCLLRLSTQSGDQAQARTHFSEAVKLDPNLRDASLKLAAEDLRRGL